LAIAEVDAAPRLFRALGGEQVDSGRGVAVDSKGNLLVLGSWEQSPPSKRRRRGARAQKPQRPLRGAVLAKYHRTGELAWALPLGQRAVEASALAVLADDSVVVGGALGERADFGTGPLNGLAFLARFSSEGAPLWAQAFPGSGQAAVLAVAAAPKDELVVVGRFRGSLRLNGVVKSAGMAAEPDAFVARFDGQGQLRWVRTIGGESGGAIAHAVAVDAMGNTIVGGAVWGELKLNGGLRFSKTDMTPWLGSYGPNGTALWFRTLDSAVGAVRAVATDLAGDIAVAGDFSGTFVFADTPCVGKGFGDVFVAVLSPSGKGRWVKHFGTPGPDRASGVAFDAHGNVAVAGVVDGALQLDDLEVGGDRTSAFAVKLKGGNGAHLGARAVGSASISVDALALGLTGEMFLVGSFERPTDFGGGVVEPTASDAFLLELRP
jgi:hypothetical protein